MELKPALFKNFFPMPLTLITTVDAGGIVNAAPYSCVMPILRPLDLIAVASALPRDTLRNILETGQFVVNVIGEPSFRKVMRCAKNYPPEINELEETGIATLASKKVAAPRVRDAIGWIEAILENEVKGEGYALLVGKAICTEINDLYLSEGKLTEEPLVMLLPHFRSMGRIVANRDDFAV